MHISGFSRVFRTEAEQHGTEKTSLLQEQRARGANGPFAESHIRYVEPEERTALPSAEDNENSHRISLAAAKLSNEADVCKESANVCAPQEHQKRELLGKAEGSFNKAARAKAFSDVYKAMQSEKWDHISTRYESAAILFKESASEKLHHDERQEKIVAAEGFFQKAHAEEQHLREAQPLPFTVETEEDEKRRCVIS